MRLWPALVAVALGACIEANLTVCPGGYDCAPGEVCDLAHHSCATQGQLDVCANSPDFAPCTSDAVSGECFDHVCLVPGCGNRVVEPGEQCDDGNHVSGDGCSLDCTSTEKCGNGFVDTARGEQCDDGNPINHDGCNSQCQVETLTLGTIPVRPTSIQQRLVAFDAARGKLVFASSPSTWELTGATWQIASLQQDVVDDWSVLVYDPDRQRVTGIGTLAQNVVVADWDGSTWTALTGITGAPQGNALAATYDTKRKAIAIVNYNGVQYLDVANLVWSAPIALPQSGALVATAFDDATGELVVLPNTVGATWLLDQLGTWTLYPVYPPADQNWALVYDPTRSAVVALGGSTSITPDGSISVWGSSNSWGYVGALARVRSGSIVWFDPSANAIDLYGGYDANGDVDDLATITSAGATSTPYVEPYDGNSIAYDSVRHHLVYMRTQPHAWTWDGAWHDTGPSPIEFTNTLVFDPVWATMVSFDNSNTWTFDGGWSAIGVGPPYMTPATTYDYANRRAIAISNQGSSVLASTTAQWTTPEPGFTATTAAYDLGAGHVVALGDGAGSTLADLVNDHWQPTLSPGIGYEVTSWFVRKSILMVPRAVGGPGEHDMFERRNGVFASRGVLPKNFMARSVTEISHGMLALAGADNASTFILTLQYTSALPDETCVPGEDADGDGLTGCDDPDCWETCWPACPYATTCS